MSGMSGSENQRFLNRKGCINALKLLGQKSRFGHVLGWRRVCIPWFGVLPVSPVMKVETPHETYVKGESDGEMGWSMVAKSKVWLGVDAVRVNRVHNWKLRGDSLKGSSVVLQS